MVESGRSKLLQSQPLTRLIVAMICLLRSALTTPRRFTRFVFRLCRAGHTCTVSANRRRRSHRESPRWVQVAGWSFAKRILSPSRPVCWQPDRGWDTMSAGCGSGQPGACQLKISQAFTPDPGAGKASRRGDVPARQIRGSVAGSSGGTPLSTTASSFFSGSGDNCSRSLGSPSFMLCRMMSAMDKPKS